MHSFHPSRGRILFDFLCALGIVASGVGAWKQTGATALLAAAAVAGLYGFVRLFDLVRRDPVTAEQPQRIDFVTGQQVDLSAEQGVVVPMVAPGPASTAEPVVEPVEPLEAEAPRVSKARRAKAPRKAGGRKAAAKEAKAAEPAAVIEFAHTDEVEAAGGAAPEDFEVGGTPPFEEPAHPHIAPLFEPEPFARMPRRAFGRKSG
jgi:hypothetical protein